MRSFWWVLVIVVIVGAAYAAKAAPPDYSNKPVDELITLLDDNGFVNRQAASEELEKRLPNLAKVDILKLVNAYSAGPLEVTKRVERLIGKYLIDLDMSPSARAALNALKTQQTGLPTQTTDGLQIPFKLGDAKGMASADTDAQKKVFSDLMLRFAAFRNYLAIGDTDGAKARLDELKNFINGLTNDQFARLRLVNKDGTVMTKADLFDLIGAARALTTQAKDEINKKMGAIPPEARPLATVAASGPLDLGKTLALSVGSLIAPGMLDVTFEDVDQALAVAPPGFMAVGPIFELLPIGDLAVGDLISVSVQYGDLSGLGFGIVDPSLLRLVRIANGDYQFLSESNDLTRHLITGSYPVSGSPSGLDQFGEFMLVQAVPEPTTLVLLFAAALGLALTRLAARERIGVSIARA